MSEDISSQVRLGATIILVAALIAAVLSLMVVAQSVLSSGLSTLQAGVSQIQNQEYEKYNNKKVTGTEVKAALSLYAGKDIGIVLRTTTCINGKGDETCWAYIYNTLLSSDGSTTGYSKVATGVNKNAVIIKSAPGTSDTATNGSAIWQLSGEAGYRSYISANANGTYYTSFETSGITKVGNAQYVLDSARFQANLVKSPDGTIIGIVFEQLE